MAQPWQPLVTPRVSGRPFSLSVRRITWRTPSRWARIRPLTGYSQVSGLLSSTTGELLAVGIDETSAFGASLTPIELWEEAVPAPTGHRAIMYEDLLPPLRARGLGAICRVLEEKIAAYRERIGEVSDGRACDRRS